MSHAYLCVGYEASVILTVLNNLSKERVGMLFHSG